MSEKNKRPTTTGYYWATFPQDEEEFIANYDIKYPDEVYLFGDSAPYYIDNHGIKFVDYIPITQGNTIL